MLQYSIYKDSSSCPNSLKRTLECQQFLKYYFRSHYFVYLLGLGVRLRLDLRSRLG